MLRFSWLMQPARPGGGSCQGSRISSWHIHDGGWSRGVWPRPGILLPCGGVGSFVSDTDVY